MPKSWVYSRLDYVSFITMGQSPNGDDVFNVEKEDSIEFHQGKLAFSDWLILNSGKYCVNCNKIAEPGSLLFCVRAPVGEINYTNRKIAIGRGLCAIKPAISFIDTKFLYYCLLFLKKFFLSNGSGSTFDAITVDVLKKCMIPIPPLNEQSRIVSILDKTFSTTKSMRDNYNEILNFSEYAKQKILESIFGDNSSYKSYYKLQDLFNFQNGYAFSSDDYSKNGIPLIRISDLVDGEVVLKDCVKINNNNIDERFVVTNGDLLIAMSGATTGKTGVYKSNAKAYLNQRVGNIKIKDNELITPECRNYLFMHLQNLILDSTHGGAQPNISGQKILSLTCYLPNKEKQKNVIQFLDNFVKQLDLIIK